MTWNSLGFLRGYVSHVHVVQEVLNLRVQGSIPANRAYNVLYLYKMNRLGQVLGEGCTRMWETILPRAIATFCRWGNIVLFTFYLTNNSEVQPTLPQCSLWSIYRDRMSTLDVPLRTSCAPRLVATSELLVIFQKMGKFLELLRCKIINTLQLNIYRVNSKSIWLYVPSQLISFFPSMAISRWERYCPQPTSISTSSHAHAG